MAQVVLFGGGGHARVLLQLLRSMGQQVLGYAAPAPSGPDLALPWLGTDDAVARRLDAEQLIGVLGIGKNDAGIRRWALLEHLMAMGIQFPSWVAPSAEVHDAHRLGSGTVVLSGAVVVTGCAIGQGCIVNTSASVDHDCVLGNDVHIAPGAVLCGGVRVGDHTLIGAGATIVPGVSVGDRVLVAAGATVTRPIPDPGLYAGNPARRIR